MSRNYDDASDKENKEKKYHEEPRGRAQRRTDSRSSRSSQSSGRSSSSGSQSSSGSSSSGSSSRSNSRSSRSSSSSSSHPADGPTSQAKAKNKPRSVSRSPRRSKSPRKSRSPDKRSVSVDRRSRSPGRRQRRDDLKRGKADGGKPSRIDPDFEHRPRSPSPKRRRKRTPSPKPPRVYISKLTRNVHKEHIQEIFANYGPIKFVEMPVFKNYNIVCNKGFAYVEFESQQSADKALRMNGGQIDGAEVFCEPADYNHQASDIRRMRSPPRNNFYPRGGGGWRRGRFFRGRMRSPPRRWSPLRQPRRRSRSPIRHRRYSRSSSSDSR